MLPNDESGVISSTGQQRSVAERVNSVAETALGQWAAHAVTIGTPEISDLATSPQIIPLGCRLDARMETIR